MKKLHSGGGYTDWLIKDEIIPYMLNLKADQYKFGCHFPVRFLYKSEIIRKHNLFFDESVWTFEDGDYVINYLDKCENIYIHDRALYTYDCRSTINHISSKYNVDIIYLILYLLKGREERFKDRYSFTSEHYINHCSNSIIDNLYKVLLYSPDCFSDVFTNICNDPFVQKIFRNLIPDSNAIMRIKSAIVSRNEDSIKKALVRQNKSKGTKNALKKISNLWKRAINKIKRNISI